MEKEQVVKAFYQLRESAYSVRVLKRLTCGSSSSRFLGFHLFRVALRTDLSAGLFCVSSLAIGFQLPTSPAENSSYFDRVYISRSAIKNEIVGKGKGHKEKRNLMGYNAENVNSSSFAQTVILQSLLPLPPFFKMDITFVCSVIHSLWGPDDSASSL